MLRTALTRTALALTVAALVLLSNVVVTQADAATIGSLKQLKAPAGCFADLSAPIAGCAAGRALLGTAPFFGSHAVAISPDGKNLYAAAFNSNSIAVFRRSASTGKLRQLPGAGGCVVNNGAAGCAAARALLRPTSVAVSPDGRSVYAASIAGSAVSAFSRNAATGRLRQLRGAAGCVSAEPGNNCAVGRALKGTDVVAVSPDGESLYAGAFESDALAVFSRDRATGAILQLPGTAGCVTQTPSTGCATGRGLNGAEGLAVSPDGKSVYVGAAVGNAVAVFRRNRSTGGVRQAAGTKGCSAFQGGEGCAVGDGLIGADSLQVSSDNKNLYVASGVGSSIAAFKRFPKTGNIRQLAGTAGCFVDRARSLGRCESGIQLDQPEGIAISPDGRTVYVGSFKSNSVTVFDRTSYTGTITQRAGPHGCFVNVATAGCTTATALGSANALAISPDGGNVYVGAYASNALAIFDRAEPKVGRVRTSVPSRIGAPSGDTISIPVSCRGASGRRCPGGISLALVSSAAGSRRGGSFNIVAGERDQVSIAVPRSVQNALSRNGTVTVTVTMRVVQPSGRIAVFREQMRIYASELG